MENDTQELSAAYGLIPRVIDVDELVDLINDEIYDTLERDHGYGVTLEDILMDENRNILLDILKEKNLFFDIQKHLDDQNKNQGLHPGD